MSQGTLPQRHVLVRFVQVRPSCIDAVGCCCDLKTPLRLQMAPVEGVRVLDHIMGPTHSNRNAKRAVRTTLLFLCLSMLLCIFLQKEAGTAAVTTSSNRTQSNPNNLLG